MRPQNYALTAGALALIACTIITTATFYICPMMIRDSKVDDVRRGTLPGLSMALDVYKAELGSFPTEQQGLAALNGKFLPGKVPRDPWGNDLIYRVTPNGKYVLYSVGVNGRDEDGQGDDVVMGPKTYSCEDYGVNCFNPCETTRSVAIVSAILSFFVVVAILLGRLRRKTA